MPVVAFVSLLTFLHYVAAQMRSPVIPLYAAAHGASATTVGLIVGAHMAAAALGSIPLGRASDVWGRRALLLAGMALGVVTSLALPLVDGPLALMAIYGLAGLGVAAFTPSALAMVGDAAPAGKAGRAFAWYSTAHYGAIGVGPFLGGLAAEWWGYRPALVGSAIGIAAALLVGFALPIAGRGHADPRVGATFASIKDNRDVWAGWIVAVSGMLVQGVVFTFFPLLAHQHGLAPASIGLVFLVLGLANTLMRFPAGWLVDRSGRRTLLATGGVLAASAATALFPLAEGTGSMLALAAVFGGVSGLAFVAVSAGLAAATTATTRGLVMGGYSTAMYLGLAIGSIALGPVMTHQGWGVGFTTGGAAGAVGALVASLIWARGRAHRPAPAPVTSGRVSA